MCFLVDRIYDDLVKAYMLQSAAVSELLQRFVDNAGAFNWTEAA